MEKIELSVARQFTVKPGRRNGKPGEFSGEEFRNKLLTGAYKEALNNKCILTVDLDGGYGYASSFLEEAFGGMVRDGYDGNDMLGRIEIKSDNQPGLIDNIKKYIRNAVIAAREEAKT